jgi:hypothetical protein
MRNLHTRLEKLEGGKRVPLPIPRIIVEPHETIDEAILREFGSNGVPEINPDGINLIAHTIVDPQNISESQDEYAC